MAIYIDYTHDSTGDELYATVENLNTGEFWNPTLGTFQPALSFADKKIALVEGVPYLYSADPSLLATLDSPGEIRVRIHDAANTRGFGMYLCWVFNNNEIANGTQSAKLASDGFDAISIDTLPLPRLLAVMAAKLNGKVADARTPSEKFYSVDGTTLRITETNDANGNRTSVTFHF